MMWYCGNEHEKELQENLDVFCEANIQKIVSSYRKLNSLHIWHTSRSIYVKLKQGNYVKTSQHAWQTIQRTIHIMLCHSKYFYEIQVLAHMFYGRKLQFFILLIYNSEGNKWLLPKPNKSDQNLYNIFSRSPDITFKTPVLEKHKYQLHYYTTQILNTP